MILLFSQAIAPGPQMPRGPTSPRFNGCSKRNYRFDKEFAPLKYSINLIAGWEGEAFPPVGLAQSHRPIFFFLSSNNIYIFTIFPRTLLAAAAACIV